MPSFPTLVVVSTSVWLLEHASGVRTETAPPSLDDADATKQFARCNYDGPEGGPPFHIGLNLAGYQPGQQKCAFRCSAQIREFNSFIMPKIFDAEFVPHARDAGGGAFCKCTAHGGSRPIIQFHDYKNEHCKPSDCWRKYLVALNFQVDQPEQVGQATLRSSCSLCAEAEECADESSLVHVDALARAMQHPVEAAADDSAPTWDAAMIQEFMAAMAAEGIILAGVNGTTSAEASERRSPTGRSPLVEAVGSSARPAMPSPEVAVTEAAPVRSATRPLGAEAPANISLPRAVGPDTPPAMASVAPLPGHAGKAPCNAKAGAFPRQCLVVPGPRGDEWIQQLAGQGCTGNQFVVQLQSGAAFAITVPAVQNLLGEEHVHAPPSAELIDAEVRWEGVDTVSFTYNFHVRAVPEGVRIGIEGLLGSEPPLDYVLSGLDVQVVLAYTQGLILRTNGIITQNKPEQVTPSHVPGFEWLPAYSYNHKAMPPNQLQVLPLALSAYADPCEPTLIALLGLDRVNYGQPFRLA